LPEFLITEQPRAPPAGARQRLQPCCIVSPSGTCLRVGRWLSFPVGSRNIRQQRSLSSSRAWRRALWIRDFEGIG